MFVLRYRCHKCQKTSFPISKDVKTCPRCGTLLDIEYDYRKMRNIVRNELKTAPRSRISHWKYWMFYPISDLRKAITLGEGGTEIMKAVKIARHSPFEIFLKNEGTNPTGSFKDRGSTIEITKASEAGAGHIACATTGNMGASVAAYSSRAGIPATIFVPSVAPERKLEQAKIHGARIVKVKGGYEAARIAAMRQAKRKGWYLAGDYPYRGEGEKSIGFEIADQFHFEMPDIIFAPMGNGLLLHSIHKAFEELAKVRLIQKIPHMVGVQAKGCPPIVNAFEKRTVDVTAVKRCRTIASAIACENPVAGFAALHAIRDSGGFALSVTDKEILSARAALGKEGIYAEPGGAAATAGLIKSLASPKYRKLLKGIKKIVVIVSGHGLKGT